MPHILSTLEFAAQSKDRLWQMMTRIYEQLARVVNGGISFGRAPATGLPDGTVVPPNPQKFNDNIDCQWIEITVTLLMAQQEFYITHKLGRPLNAYIVARCSNPVILYDGSANANNPTPNQTYHLGAYSPAGFPVQMVLLLF